MSEQRVCDQDVRDRVTTDLGTTFLLEAGAGTGKTRVLVDRYVSCVLDPERGTGDVRTVAAITFTEKAAGELRQRVREEFERLAAGTAGDAARTAVIQGALDALDDAPISTIHGFAGRLLREFPVEAEVDPAFEQLDALGSDLEKGRLWEEWLSELAMGDPSAGTTRRGLSRLLRAGVRLEWLRTLAVGPRGVFGERYDLDPEPASLPEPDLEATLPGLVEALDRLASFCSVACSKSDDKGCVAALDLVDAGRALAGHPPDDVDQLAAALFSLPVKATPTAPGGAKVNWSPAHGGKDELQTRYRDAAAEVLAAREAYSAFLTTLAVSVADAFSRWAAQTQLALGRLDFTDLLGLPARPPGATTSPRGQTLQARFRYLLVDEFQDTDPLQAEIVFFLCEREPVAADWREVILEPGKLFVVGDPKQSIYRFRRADIGMYDEVKRQVAGQPGGTGALEAIGQNFRTTPAVVQWVNNVFADVFDEDREEGRQPGYQWVEPFRPPGRGSARLRAAGRRLTAARRGPPTRRGAPRRRRWPRSCSTCTARSRSAGACRTARRTPTAPATPSRRARRAGATSPCSSAPPPASRPTSRRSARPASRTASTAARPTSSGARSTTRCSACAPWTTRATGPPCTERSTRRFFGFSDDELFLFWAGGGRFDLFAAQPEAHAAVGAALATLARAARAPRRRASRTSSPPSWCGSHRAVRVPRGHRPGWRPGHRQPREARRPRSRLRRRGRRRPRGVPRLGGGGRRRRRGAGVAGGRRGRRRPPAHDPQGQGARVPHRRPRRRRARGGGAGAASRSWTARRSVGWRSASRPSCRARRPADPRAAAVHGAQGAREAHGGERSCGVFCTWPPRAPATASSSRCFGRLDQQGRVARGGALLGPDRRRAAHAGCDRPRSTRTAACSCCRRACRRALDGQDGAPDDRDLADARRAGESGGSGARARAAPAPATSPSGLEHVDQSREHRGAGRAGRPSQGAGAGLGRPPHHGALRPRRTRRRSPPSPTAVAAELERPDLAVEAAELALACWRAAPVRAAAAAAARPRAVHRELQVGFVVDEVIVSGAIDLLYRDGDAWVVVDYKTDRAAEPDVLLEPLPAARRRVRPRRRGGPRRRAASARCASSPHAPAATSSPCRWTTSCAPRRVARSARRPAPAAPSARTSSAARRSRRPRSGRVAGMDSGFIAHLQRNWPLTALVVGIALYLVVCLAIGVFYTNQGLVYRSATPARYWRWVQLFGLLLLGCAALLVGSYLLA